MKLNDLIWMLSAIRREHGGDIEVFIQNSESELDRFREPTLAKGRMNDAGYKELESEIEYGLKWRADYASDELADKRREYGMSEERIALMQGAAADHLCSYKEQVDTFTKLFISI